MFEWKDAYSVGIGIIDEQHMRLFEIGRNLLNIIDELSSSELSDEIITALEDLKEYTMYHFNTEEELLIKYGYEDYESHVEEHNIFIDKLNRLSDTNFDEDPKKVVKDIVLFVAKWIITHINDRDFKYSSFLKENMN